MLNIQDGQDDVRRGGVDPGTAAAPVGDDDGDEEFYRCIRVALGREPPVEPPETPGLRLVRPGPEVCATAGSPAHHGRSRRNAGRVKREAVGAPAEPSVVAGGEEQSRTWRFLTVEEVADWLHVHRNTVYAWVGQGHLPARVLAEGTRRKCIRIDPVEFERWRAERPRP